MYIGLGTLQTVYCTLCKGAIILAMSAPIILINNNKTSTYRSATLVVIFALQNVTWCQSQAWINERVSGKTDCYDC